MKPPSFQLTSFQIQVALAEECQIHAPSHSKDEIKKIEISTLDSISHIVEIAVKSWGLKRPSNVHDPEKESRQLEYGLTIENVNGKEPCYEYLNETNRKNLGIGKINTLVLQYSPKVQASTTIQDLKLELKTMKENGESKENIIEDSTKRSSTTNENILPLEVLDLFRKFARYTKDPVVTKDLLELKGFELIKDSLYLPLFQLPLNDEKRRQNSNNSFGSDNSPNSLGRKASSKPMFPKISKTKSPIKSKPSMVVHEEIETDNLTNIVMCLSYMLESMAALVSADPNVFLADGPKMGHQISQFLQIDEIYYQYQTPTISKSCSFLLTCIAQILQKDGNLLTVKNEQPWFQIRPLLALHKRSSEHQIKSIECFVSIYSLSSKYLRQKMINSFNEYQIKNRDAFLGNGKFSLKRIDDKTCAISHLFI